MGCSCVAECVLICLSALLTCLGNLIPSDLESLIIKLMSNMVFPDMLMI